ncbi:unnamed protein product, partial [Mesorhabditis spiculigera]
MTTASILTLDNNLSVFIRDNVAFLEPMLAAHGIHFATFTRQKFVKVVHPETCTPDYIRFFLMECFAAFNYERAIHLSKLDITEPNKRTENLNELQYVVARHYKEWICLLTGVSIEYNLDRSVTLIGEAPACETALQVINHLAGQLVASATEPNATLQRDVSAAADCEAQAAQLKESKERRFMNTTPTLSRPNQQGSLQYLLSMQNTLQSPSTTSSRSERYFKDGMKTPTFPLTPISPLRLPTMDRQRTAFYVNSAEAPRLIGTRGINKKKLENITGCQLMLHTESRCDGMFPIEVLGESEAVCEAAKQTILEYLASSATIPGAETPCKSTVPAKVVLQLSPRKKPVVDSALNEE